MRPPSRFVVLSLALAVVLVAVCIWLVSLARARPFAIAGDPWGVYFPIVQGLWRGEGLASFAPLTLHGLRMPGYPVALALGAVFATNLVTAGQLVGIGAALAATGLVVWGAHRYGASVVSSAAAGLVLTAHANFTRAAIEPLPDMLYLVFFAGSVFFTLAALGGKSADGEMMVESAASRAGATDAAAVQHSLIGWAGVVAGLGFLIRVNGLALIIATAVGLWAGLPPRRRAVTVKHYLRGAGLGTLPWLVLIIGLRPHVSYPFISLSASGTIRAATGGAGPVAGLGIAILNGVADVPHRVASSVPWWLALIGFAALFAAVGRDRSARMLVVIGLGMGGLLVPMHFEPRYYLFLPVLLLPAAAVGFERMVARFAPRWVGTLGFTLLAAVAVLTAVPFAQAENAREAQVGRELTAVCDALEFALASGPRPRLVGVSRGEVYSRQRSCPQPMRDEPSTILLVRASPNERGLDAWLARPDESAPPGLVKLGAASGYAIYGPPAQAPIPAAPHSEVIEAALELEVPHRRRCVERELSPQAGDHEIYVLLDLSPGLAASVTLEQGEHRWSAWSCRGGRVELGHATLTNDTARLRLCAASAHAWGRMSVRGVELGPGFGPRSSDLDRDDTRNLAPLR